MHPDISNISKRWIHIYSNVTHHASNDIHFYAPFQIHLIVHSIVHCQVAILWLWNWTSRITLGLGLGTTAAYGLRTRSMAPIPWNDNSSILKSCFDVFPSEIDISMFLCDIYKQPTGDSNMTYFKEIPLQNVLTRIHCFGWNILEIRPLFLCQISILGGSCVAMLGQQFSTNFLREKHSQAADFVAHS